MKVKESQKTGQNRCFSHKIKLFCGLKVKKLPLQVDKRQESCYND